MTDQTAETYEPDARPQTTLSVRGVVDPSTGLPKLVIMVNENNIRLPVAEAREMALVMLSESTRAEDDAMLQAYLFRRNNDPVQAMRTRVEYQQDRALRLQQLQAMQMAARRHVAEEPTQETEAEEEAQA